jgi:hypothetical protein
MRAWLALVPALLIVALGCAKPNSIVGTWTLYVPADLKAAAEKKGEAVPSGTAEFKSDGTCKFKIQGPGLTYAFEGTYTVAGTTLEVKGTQTSTETAKPILKRTLTGSLSEDFKTFRIDGKDFQR